MLPVVVPTLPPPLPSSPDDRPRNRGSDGVIGRDPRSRHMQVLMHTGRQLRWASWSSIR
jgi:hypothetical protein